MLRSVAFKPTLRLNQNLIITQPKINSEFFKWTEISSKLV